MTLERTTDAELFGLAGSFPRPGWTVLDAARDHRFTGELAFEVLPEVRVYFDRGEIYLAERVNEPSLGLRLVDAGVLSEVQRARGSIVVGDGEHLGRLFERVPSVDHDAVTLITEMMNDECVSWLARQQVRGVVAEPYRRHVSGVHRWVSSTETPPLRPGDPLPAPPADASPVAGTEPVARLDDDDGVPADDLVQWDEPSWLDERIVRRPPPASVPPTPDTSGGMSNGLQSDWVERLATDGLPDADDDPLTKPRPLPSVAKQAPDRFELIWPSGDVDEKFGAVTHAHVDDPDRDRAGPTVRLGGFEPADPPSVEPAVWEFELGSALAQPSGAPSPSTSTEPVVGTDTDDVVLAVRRAVASIETGSLDARRRLANDPTGSAGTHVVPPGRYVMPTLSGVAATQTSRSVFDDDLPVAPPISQGESDAPDADTTTAEPERVSALRRLIGGLRRR